MLAVQCEPAAALQVEGTNEFLLMSPNSIHPIGEHQDLVPILHVNEINEVAIQGVFFCGDRKEGRREVTPFIALRFKEHQTHVHRD